ncbi:MAG: hypothetical protein EPN91_00195 [Salinibacterium sp.]|nr:MAG: hypothetical protein EPN91_00195 [Salinibacterium sp.]
MVERALWLHDRTVLAIITWGSSGCPPVPVKIEVPTKQTIAVTFVKSPHEVCTMDYAPTTHEFPVPQGIDPNRKTTVKLDLPDEKHPTLTVEG